MGDVEHFSGLASGFQVPVVELSSPGRDAGSKALEALNLRAVKKIKAVILQSDSIILCVKAKSLGPTTRNLRNMNLATGLTDVNR